MNALLWMLIGSAAMIGVTILLGAVLAIIVVAIKMRGGKRL